MSIQAVRRLAVTFLAGTSLSSATVTIQFEFEALRDSFGTELATSVVAVLIADSNGDGLLPNASQLVGTTLQQGSIVGGDSIENGDAIFFAGLTDSDPGPGNFGGSVTVDYAALGINQGDPWGVYWFPSLDTVGTSVTEGLSYGAFQSSVLDSAAVAIYGESEPMVFPADAGSVVTTGYLDTTIITLEGGTPTADTPTTAEFSASFVTVPEPSSFILMAFGALALVRRRR